MSGYKGNRNQSKRRGRKPPALPSEKRRFTQQNSTKKEPNAPPVTLPWLRRS